jgi:hypothetical protein
MAPKLSKAMKSSSKVIKDAQSPKKSAKKGEDAKVPSLAMKVSLAMKANACGLTRPAGIEIRFNVV